MCCLDSSDSAMRTVKMELKALEKHYLHNYIRTMLRPITECSPPELKAPLRVCVRECVCVCAYK